MRRRRCCTGGRWPSSNGPWAGATPRPPPAGATTAASSERRLGRAVRRRWGRTTIMPDLATLRSARRPELLIGPLGDRGQYVVKDLRTGAFFQLGEAESFLLTQLDGERTTEAVRAAYAERFGEPLSEDDLDAFVEQARSQGLLRAEEDTSSVATGGRQGILHWRKSLWDPDRFFSWLAPRIGFFWTPSFLLGSAGCIVFAALLVWAHRQELAGCFTHALRWET